MKEELKRCPFCGGKAEIREIATRTSSIGGFYVMCTKCKTSGDNYSKAETATRAWNIRTEAET